MMEENKTTTVSRVIVRQIEKLAEFNKDNGDSVEFHENCRSICSLTETLLHMQNQNNLIDFSFAGDNPKQRIVDWAGSNVPGLQEIADKVAAMLKEAGVGPSMVESIFKEARSQHDKVLEA
jgi:hypothetical protein